MKRIFILLFLSMMIITGCGKKKTDEPITNTPSSKIGVPLMEFDQYKDFSIDKVKSLKIIRYTVAGADDETINDKSVINEKYNSLRKYVVLDETDRACEDNTTIYRFNMQDGTSTSFEFECDWLVIGRKHYNIKRSN